MRRCFAACDLTVKTLAATIRSRFDHDLIAMSHKQKPKQNAKHATHREHHQTDKEKRTKPRRRKEEGVEFESNCCVLFLFLSFFCSFVCVFSWKAREWR